MLLRGEGDIAAANLTVTKERSNKVQFVENHLTTRQVLVQRLPENLRGLTADDIENSLVRNPLELAGKKIHVRKNSSFYKRLQHLAEEIGEEIEIIEASGDTDSEKLFEMVSTGEIDYTIADENIALINKNRFSNIDINTAISFEQKIAWAVHPRATILAADLNEWIAKKKKTNAYHTIKNKYFKASRTHSIRAKSDYSSLAGGRISEYDELLKKYSNQINWDWRLVASIVYHESKFQSDAESWMCAKGLMQMLPETAEKYGANDSTLLIPEYSIKAGTAYLKVLEKYWLQHIDDETERVKFTLASYNVGLGHVIDARNLADKFNKNPNLWDDNVSHFMKLKSTPEYYRDEVVKFGYCRGSEPVRYVKDILQTYGHYLNHIVE
jgi:membrane-bound lytic murein transglycosylase F